MAFVQYTTLESQVSHQQHSSSGGILKNWPNQSPGCGEAGRDGKTTGLNEMVQSPGKKGVRIVDESTDSQVFQDAHSARKSPMRLHRTENFYSKPSGKKLTQTANQIKILDQS